MAGLETPIAGVRIRTLTARKRTGCTSFTGRNLPTGLAWSLRYRRVEG